MTNNLDDNNIDKNIIECSHENFQLSENGKSFSQSKWMVEWPTFIFAMQMLYVQKLQSLGTNNKNTQL